MKNVKSIFNKGLFLMAIIFMYSCQEEELNPKNQPDIVNQKSELPIVCATIGPSTGSSGDVLSYSYSSSMPTNIVWSVLSGNITIQSGHGTNTASVLLGSNFLGGEIEVVGTPADGPSCSQKIRINPTVEIPCVNPPTQSWVSTEPCATLAMVVKNVSNATHFRFYIDNQFVGERPKNQNSTTTHLLYSLITNSLNLSSGSHIVGISAVNKYSLICPETSKLNKSVIIGFCNSPTPI